MGYRFLPADYRIRKGTCWGRSREYNHSKAVSLCLERLLAWVSASSYLISWSPTSSPGGSPRASYITQRRCLWVKESKGMNHSAPWAWDFKTNEVSAESLQGSSLACSQGQGKAEPWFQESGVSTQRVLNSKVGLCCIKTGTRGGFEKQCHAMTEFWRILLAAALANCSLRATSCEKLLTWLNPNHLSISVSNGIL